MCSEGCVCCVVVLVCMRQYSHTHANMHAQIPGTAMKNVRGQDLAVCTGDGFKPLVEGDLYEVSCLQEAAVI